MKILLLIITFLCTFPLNVHNSYSDTTKKVNATLIYDQCSKFIHKNEVYNIQEFWENICAFVRTSGWDLFILTKQESKSWAILLTPPLLSELRGNYYRWEEIDIHLEWEPQALLNEINFTLKNISYKATTLKKWYTISLLSDSLLSNNRFSTITEFCTFKSYNPKCTNTQVSKIVNDVDTLLSDLVISKEVVLSWDSKLLTSEIQKLVIIAKKLNSLKWKYKTNKVLLFTLEYIIYKIEVNKTILNNALEDVAFYRFLKANDIYFKDKVILWDLYISQSDQFTFFYYNDKRVNTLKTDTSHFDELELAADPRLKSDIEYLKKKIREKYSADFIKESSQSLMFIKKTYTNTHKYLLFDTNTLILHTLDWDITQLQKWKKWYYFLTQNSNQDQTFVLYDWKKIQKIINETKWYKISWFELLSWGKVKLFYTIDNWEVTQEVIDISTY